MGLNFIYTQLWGKFGSFDTSTTGNNTISLSSSERVREILVSKYACKFATSTKKVSFISSLFLSIRKFGTPTENITLFFNLIQLSN